MSSFSPLLYRTSRPWRFEPSVHRPLGARRLPKIGRVRVVAAAITRHNTNSGPSQPDQNHPNSMSLPKNLLFQRHRSFATEPTIPSVIRRRLLHQERTRIAVRPSDALGHLET